MTRQRCEHCPVAEGSPCLGIQADFAYMCEFARSGEPIKVRHVIERSAIAEGEPPPSSSAPYHEREFTEAQLLILACDYRLRSDLDCGCTATEYCAQQKGPDRSSPFAVGYADCLACVRTT